MARPHVVLVLNAGSSSLKYQVVVPARGERLLDDQVPHVDRTDWGGSLSAVAEAVRAAGLDGDLTAVGHRVVHGGDLYVGPTVVDDGVLAGIESLHELAPLHNPAAAEGIRHARATYPGLPQVAVFDTGFFSDLPATARTLPLDRSVVAAEGLHRFGMHGISHEYVAHATADLLARDVREIDQITLHLGNGASAAAVRRGQPVETSMGLTPLEGLVMGTRGGDVDPGALLYLLRHGDHTPEDLEDLLNHRSGLQGLTGSSDFRDLMTGIDAGDEDARLAYDVYCHRLRKYVGAYLAVLGGADVIVFTGGVGEHTPRLREDSLAGLEPLGIDVDPGRNRRTGAGPGLISTPTSRVAVVVVPTDEELAIARKVADLLGG